MSKEKAVPASTGSGLVENSRIARNSYQASTKLATANSFASHIDAQITSASVVHSVSWKFRLSHTSARLIVELADLGRRALP